MFRIHLSKSFIQNTIKLLFVFVAGNVQGSAMNKIALLRPIFNVIKIITRRLSKIIETC